MATVLTIMRKHVDGDEGLSATTPLDPEMIDADKEDGLSAKCQSTQTKMTTTATATTAMGSRMEMGAFLRRKASHYECHWAVP